MHKGHDDIRTYLPTNLEETEKVRDVRDNGGSNTTIHGMENNAPHHNRQLQEEQKEDLEDEKYDLNETLLVMDGQDFYMVLPQVTSDRELGMYLINQRIVKCSEEDKPNIDYARIGAEYREADQGVYSSDGYVQKKYNEMAPKPIKGIFRVWLEAGTPDNVPVHTAQLTLPATFEEIEQAKQMLGIDKVSVIKITKAECLKLYLERDLPLQEEALNLEILNELAEKIELMDQQDDAYLKYISILEVEQPKDFETAFRLSDEIDNYEFVECNPAEYGKQALKRIGIDEEVISVLDNFTNFYELGCYYMQEDGLRITEFGPICRISEPFTLKKDGPAMY